MDNIERHNEYEQYVLKPYALRNCASKGRVHLEPAHSYRPPFERDRERIIHSTSFRRLTYKTQVFVNNEGDHFRTRLTHTLETATIARAIAFALGLNTDLTEAISLAHDLGHTPFGHTGEEVLDDLMRDTGGFEHNRQSLRVVDCLEIRYPAFEGINLTFETREGIQKHVTRYDSAPENDEFPGRWPSLEGQTVCIADEIAYMCHDLDDGIYSGLIDFDEAEKLLPLWGKLISDVREEYTGIGDELLRKEAVRRLINIEVTDAIEASDKLLAEFAPNNPDEVRLLQNKLINHSSNISEWNELLGKYLFENLYRHYKVLRMSTKAKMIIEGLFDYYLEDPRQLPEGSRKRLQTGKEKIVIADYIAGMTDRYAMREYKKFTDPFEKFL